MWDQEVWREAPEDIEDLQGVGVFFQYGSAPRDFYEAKSYIGFGLQWVGAIPGRDDDVLGFGVFRANFSELAGFDEPFERAVEFYYRIQLFPWLALKPDTQYIANPGGLSNRDAMTLGLRLEVAF